MATVMNNEGEYGIYYVTELKAPDFPQAFLERYAQFGTRVRWLDSNVVPGAFQINVSWYHHAMPDPIFPEEHTHPEDEVVAFFGSDSENPEDLGGIVEFTMNGETHRIDKSCMIFVPGGMKHLPLKLVEVRRPILHFSITLSKTYIAEDKNGKSIYDQ
jgi:hypothetical protein